MLEPKPLTLQEVADYLSLNQDYLRRLARQGKIESFKVGNQFRFTQESVKNYMNKGNKNA